MGLASEIEDAITLLLDTFVTTKSAALCGLLTPVALTAGTIYVIMIGYAVMRGETNDPLHTSLWKFAKMAFIGALALGAGTYQEQVLQAFYGVQEGLISAFSTATTVGGVIDQFMVPYDSLANAIGQEASTSVVPNLTLYAAMVIVIIAQVWIFAIGIGLYLLAKVALALILALGPAFILCAMFPATQRFTESWIAQVINYVILSVLVVASFTMLTLFAKQFAEQALANYGDDGAVIKDCVALLIVSVALGVVMLNLNTIASGLAGGATISGGGMVNRLSTGAALVAGVIAAAAYTGKKSREGGGQNAIGQGSGSGSGSGSGGTASNGQVQRLPLYQSNVIENINKSN